MCETLRTLPTLHTGRSVAPSPGGGVGLILASNVTVKTHPLLRDLATHTMDRIGDYDYQLPEELIASEPPPHREDARLMVVERSSGRIDHRGIRDLPEFLQPGDALVLNDTRVLPARLFGVRTKTGGKWEGLFLRTDPDGSWRLLGQTKGKLTPGEAISVYKAHAPDDADRLVLTLRDRDSEGIWTARPDRDESPVALLNQFGTMPLPPYMKKPLATEDDWNRYQTTFAVHPGSVAAPTAGLHFTAELLEQCRTAGAKDYRVTLHVGIGTFRPIAVDRLDDHVMHSEWCELCPETAAALSQTRADGGRIVTVGTTTVRTLESAARTGAIHPFCGETDLFIRPPYTFRAVDVLLTNFHLPRSSLLVLVSAFAGRELVLRAYAEAIRQRYRFYSYGDAMLIV